MANPAKNEVAVILDGKEYTLRADMDCLQAIESECKRGLFAIMDDITFVRVTDMVSIIKNGLKSAGDTSVGISEIQNLILKMGISPAFIAISPFFNQVMYGPSLGKPLDAPAKS